MKKIFSLMLLIIASFILVSCGETYLVTFDTNGASLEIKSQEVSSGKKVVKPADPEKEGFIFK